MSAAAKERLYLCVTVFCLLMCGAMIVGMCFGGNTGKADHVPTIREITDGNVISTVSDEGEDLPSAGQIAITEDFIMEQFGRFLPDNFPLKNPTIDIGADGIITFTGNVNKEALRSYLKDNGIKLDFKYSLALLLLPREFAVEVALKVSEGSDGKLLVEPYSLYIAGKSIPIAIFPQKVTQVMSDAVNNVVSSIGGTFGFSGFEDGAIIFEKIN